MPSLENLYEQRLNTITRLNELEAIERNQETFDSVRDSLDQVKGVMGQTSTDLKEATEGFRRLKEAHEKLTGFLNDELTELDGVMNAAGQLADGLSQAASMTGNVRDAIGEIQSTMDEIERLIALGEEAKPDEILEGFEKYLGTVVDILGSLVGRIPGLGAFLYIYLKAIGSIRISIQKIQDIVTQRNALMQELFGEDLYVTLLTSNQKRQQAIEELKNKIEALNEQILNHPDYFPPPTYVAEDVPEWWEDEFGTTLRSVELVTHLNYARTFDNFTYWKKRFEESKTAWESWQQGHFNLTNPGDLSGALTQESEELQAQHSAANAELQNDLQNTELGLQVHNLSDAITQNEGNLSNVENEIARGEKLKGRYEHAARAFDRLSMQWLSLRNFLRERLINDLTAGTIKWTPGTLKQFNKAHPELAIQPEEIKHRTIRNIPWPVAGAGCLSVLCIGAVCVFAVSNFFTGDESANSLVLPLPEQATSLPAATNPPSQSLPSTSVPTPVPTVDALASLREDAKIVDAVIALVLDIASVGTINPNGHFTSTSLAEDNPLLQSFIFFVADSLDNVYLGYLGDTDMLSINFSLFMPGDSAFSPSMTDTLDLGTADSPYRPSYEINPTYANSSRVCYGRSYALFNTGKMVESLPSIRSLSIWSYKLKADSDFDLVHRELDEEQVFMLSEYLQMAPLLDMGEIKSTSLVPVPLAGLLGGEVDLEGYPTLSLMFQQRTAPDQREMLINFGTCIIEIFE